MENYRVKRNVRVSIDLAKNNSGVCINENGNYTVLSVRGIESGKNFIKSLTNYGKIEFLIEIAPTSFKGKYNLISQNQLLGLIFGFIKAYNIDAEFNYIYPMEGLSLYQKLRHGRKFPKELRIDYVREYGNVEVNNDDEADAVLIMLKFEELVNRHEDRTIGGNG